MGKSNKRKCQRSKTSAHTAEKSTVPKILCAGYLNSDRTGEMSEEFTQSQESDKAFKIPTESFTMQIKAWHPQ